eukprot:CAMPEP_0181221100 /NCGR_PEP_ID=MMETSP1096-20121128/29204_1 /TAXON_ID=156174 ORGANISM="Chrysochromulina ericina, Strain CCMP281" /NCGR_SAMPLE_ID=MMETSP1096 /ASSEMBLY_ACC=CAM_ASM_000453 /LENGTH=524 /DNA_ID=CAMNT_0023313675 /DNA_START=85 /DNA_END=1659 /DNA_ORIENTATION=+
MSQTADLKAALQPLQLPPEVQAAAERRASNMCAHLRPVGSPHLWSARPAEASSVGAPANIDSFGEQAVLTPAYVAALDAQHDRLWQSLEQHTMPSLVEARQVDQGKVLLDEQSTRAQGLEGFARAQELNDAYNQVQQQVPSGQVRLDSAWADAAQNAGSAGALEQAWSQQVAGSEALEHVWGEQGASPGGLDASFAQLQEVWESLAGSSSEFDSIWESYGQDGLDAHWDSTANEEYMFKTDNPYTGQTGLLRTGTILFEKGELAQAVLALEAAVQQQPEDSIAWQTLGQAHADSDDDQQAIICLRKAVTSDPHNLDALLSLGVSFTNELDQTRALLHLQHWLESHPEFAALEVPTTTAGVAHNPFVLQQQVTSLFLRAAELSPQSADIHAVLGVLYNLSREYPLAIEAFEAALKLRPTDYSLWNKLGATQANAMSCEAAVPCYVHALELKPQYVRALSNLGISYGNMRSYEAAAQCYLKALSLNPDAKHIWNYLSMTFTSMSRPDLVEKAQLGDHNAFRADFDF